MNRSKHESKNKKLFVFVRVCSWLILSALTFSACSQLEKPKPEPFYAQTAPPQKKEFRWSNGKMPKSFDPALAAAPPETDIVRAVFEGLTDTDARTLEAVPAVALEWKASEDFKAWTFYLRKDVRWSNGERVTAQDFVRSWKRLSEMGEKVSHPELLENIVGLKVPEDKKAAGRGEEEIDNFSKPLSNLAQPFLNRQANTNSANTVQKNENPPSPMESPTTPPSVKTEKDAMKKQVIIKPGIEAVDNFTLKISLIAPDKNFPALVAHPLFRPVYGDGKDFESGKLSAAVTTNGAFQIVSVGADGVTLDRAENFWNKDKIELERVKFVPQENAEKALEAYRAGEIDAVTNADFEPLALKLLQPFRDFRRATHSALNFYEFNRGRKPFDDRRVREALTISIERERLTEGEMEGSTRPALSFLPFGEKDKTKFVQDNDRARDLLAEAGYAKGENFPEINLVVNRNDVQLRIARAVAKMWKQNLNIETKIVIKETSEIENVKTAGDFDILRRGVVLPTSDETASLQTIFPLKSKPEDAVQKKDEPKSATTEKSADEKKAETEITKGQIEEQNPVESTDSNIPVAAESADGQSLLTEEDAVTEIPGIPLYFPTSYSLVKPYVQGFEINTLDAPSLKEVRIDNNWQPKKSNGES